ncbi:Sushi, von Willebrand factor type A, EGF and pentraxin domain-containing protein 1 [Halotydeus destructor]|nr:Sushi, von Willebrand factor type A, EGF and pentraxin domain-containing protein 1 [Halotydeus destructor]
MILVLLFLIRTVSGQVCPTIVPPPYGSLIRPCGTNYQDTCYITCPRGWDILGTCFRVCQANGRWSGTDVRCLNRAIMCPPIRPLLNGVVLTPCYNVAGGTCSFRCCPGFTSLGSTTIACRDNGQWASSPPTCSSTSVATLPPPARGCGAITAGPAGGRILGQCQGVVNEQCTFACDNGYQLIGYNPIVCQSNGQWSAPVPTCMPNGGCPNINPPANGYSEGTCANAKTGQTCVFNCFTGYRLVGVTSVTCRGTAWDGSAPQCQAITCANLVAPPNGRLTGTCSPGRLGQNCTVTCNLGFRPSSQTVIQCTNSGWSTGLPTCNPIQCPNIGSIQNGFSEGPCNPGQAEKVCTFSCNPGFALAGNSTLLCQSDGKWARPLPFCVVVTCVGRPLTGTELTVVPSTCTSSVPVGQSCSYSCGSCSRISGAAVSTCRPTTQWSSPLPTCQRVTCPGQTVDNAYGQGACNPGVCGTDCTYTCTPGFRLIGQAKLSCTSAGQFNNPFPTCQAITCQALTPPANGNFPSQCSNNAGTTCALACDRCYTGSGVYTCGQDGAYQPSTPLSCRPITCQGQVVANSVSQGSCNPGQCGSDCTITCNPGFQLIGQNRLTCTESGQFNYPAPTCQAVSCPPLQLPANGRFASQCSNSAGTTCAVVCDNCYVTSGPTVYSCGQNGQYSPTTPAACQRVTCPSQAVANAVTQGACDPGTCGADCTFTCNPGYQLIGQSRLTCTASRQFNYPFPYCQSISCPTLTAPANGQLSGVCGPGQVGATCNVACNAGYRLSGSQTATCGSNGQWSNPLATCVANTCPTVTAPLYGVWINQCTTQQCDPSCLGQPGAICNLICGQGFRPADLRSIRCSENTLQWEPDPSQVSCVANNS